MKIRDMIFSNPILRISYTAIMIVIVFIFTVIFSLYIPETKGFFNIGETGVYIAAITGGPVVGAIAGGLGSALSDISLGYGIYAPGTLIIKGLEGLIVGYLSILFEKIFKNKKNRFIGTIIGVLFGILLYILGTMFYVGKAEISLVVGEIFNLELNFSELMWGISAIIVILLIISLSWRKIEYIGYVLATVIGGIEMILGYFLYEQLILGVAALVEVPFNTMQMTVGTILSIIIVGVIEKVGGEKK